MTLTPTDRVESSAQDVGDDVAGSFNDPFRLRSYQAEMVEASLKENIIVAMDTGSGKTHIAVARAAAALETCRPDQLVWFLAPTVALCTQQFDVFCKHLPAFDARFLSGSDNTEHWKNQSIWDAVLKNIRVVVSTPQVLLDALTHAFVKIEKLALLIFDEAHHCISKHPTNLIMQQFYRHAISCGNRRSVPRILGLSASPVISTKAGGLEIIERNMHSITRTPKVHRSELIRHVHIPELLRVTYPGSRPESMRCPGVLAALQQKVTEYDLKKDPYVLELKKRRGNGDNVQKEWSKVMLSQQTYCSKQLRSLADKCNDMLPELGGSAIKWYLPQCVLRFQDSVGKSDQHSLTQWSDTEKQYLCGILRALCHPEQEPSSYVSVDELSAKVETLIELLLSEHSADFTGLVFVEQRAWVATLAQLLAAHPRVGSLFNIGTYVGTSVHSRRKLNIADLADPLNQQETLDDFRVGKKNLILTTSVLEEGIDVSSCHLVICFEPPKNLKSFIQRRGRARRERSKYVILLPRSGPSPLSADKWHDLEEEMKAAYLDDLREVKLAEERELTQEHGSMQYRVPATGALLTLDNASQHLHHFCAVIQAGPYIDSRPQFTFDRDDGDLIRAEVMLPISVEAALRTASSSCGWLTERMAKNDAAFQAYMALHSAGLVNDNLLPLIDKDDEPEFNIPDHRPALVWVSPNVDPWVWVAEQQQFDPFFYHRVLLKLETDGEPPVQMILLSPCGMPILPRVTLFWNASKQYSVTSSRLPSLALAEPELKTMRVVTHKLLSSVYGSRMDTTRNDFLWLLIPTGPQGPFSLQELEEWNVSTEGCVSGLDFFSSQPSALSEFGFVNVRGDHRVLILKSILHSTSYDSGEAESKIAFEMIRAPKRRDFLHPILEGNSMNNAYSRIYEHDAAECLVSRLPARYSIFALFVPSIIHRYETLLIAEDLRTTILQPISFNQGRVTLVLKAITSSSTNDQENYQRLEFLGDCVLKFITSVHLMAAHPNWPESYLTNRKCQTNSNGFLARATMTAGLDKYIIRKSFTGLKWRPRYASDVLQVSESGPDEKVSVSSKILADVVESLIGACFVEGGLHKAFTCVKTLLTQEDWTPLEEANSSMFEVAPSELEITHLAPVESLLGYTFQKKSLLLEALTHASFTGPHAAASYERLEFLGDAVLDYMIVQRLYSHTPELSHQTMHAIRTAMVNASFLAFRMFETTVSMELDTIVAEPNGENPVVKPGIVEKALWQYTRQSTAVQLMNLRTIAQQSHQTWRKEILEALQNDKKYPWHLFARTDPDKFFSDIVESVIGAIYVDSKGDVSQCEAFIGKLGILDVLERILRDGVDCLHPKERLGHLAVSNRVQYVKVGTGEDGTYKCLVKVGEREVGDVVGGLKRLNAETEAAWRAVRVLEGEDVKMGDADEAVYGDVDVGEEDEELVDDEDGGVLVDSG